jgi:hypothetical protein
VGTDQLDIDPPSNQRFSAWPLLGGELPSSWRPQLLRGIRNGQDESCRVEPAEITLESTHPSVGIR